MFKKRTYKELEQRIQELERAESKRNLDEKALQESEERYRSLFKNHHSVMLLIDPESAAIVDANLSAISYYGWSHNELTCKKITDINMLTKDEVFQEMENAKSERRRYFNFKHRLANGDVRDVEVYSGPIKTGGKQLLYSIVHDISDRKKAEEEREKLLNKLQKALSEVKILRGFLPICAYCKKIRDDQGYWNQIESYIHKHSEAEFSHSICPECMKKHHPEYENDDKPV